jgi:uracil-DNA glycosylase family 4
MIDPAHRVTEPEPTCTACPRLVAFRERLRISEPDWHNAPVQSFLPRQSSTKLLIVGLAPGMKGANRTGRPFTGDYAGDLLYATLSEFGFTEGTYAARPDDGLALIECEITNAVRCLPPENKPTPAEIKTCRTFLAAKLETYTDLRAVLALGQIAHTATIAALGARQVLHKFAHGARHDVRGLSVFDSYHCSRYNTNTGRLTKPMFRDVFREIRGFLEAHP